MKTMGLVAAFIDVPQEHTEDYNRWYDFDHLPEYVALPEFLSARRYVATPDMKKLRPESSLEDLKDGRGTYFTNYLLGTDDLAKVRESFGERSAFLRDEHRIFRHGRVVDVGFYKLEHISARGDIPVRDEAIPYLGHRGVMAVLTRVEDASRREEVDRWFREIHAPDLLGVPGFVAAMRFSRFDGVEGRYMNLYLLDGEPTAAVRALEKHRERWMAQGRSPSPGGASKILFSSAYRYVVPAQYDFSVE